MKVKEFVMIPQCQVPGCCKPAHNCRRAANPYYRRSKEVREQFGVVPGFICVKHHGLRYGMLGWTYKQFRKEYCENKSGQLGFVCTTTIVDPEWQLDGDHINGDPSDDTKENIQTLCKCCHAIKTRDKKDYLTPGRKTLNCN